MTKAKPDKQPDTAPAMPFDEALKRVWSAPPMHKVKPAKKTAGANKTKPPK